MASTSTTDHPNSSTTTLDGAVTTVRSSNPWPPATLPTSTVAAGELLPETGRDVRVPVAAALALLTVGAICVISARRNLRKERT